MFLFLLENCKVLNATILINVARCLNNLISRVLGIIISWCFFYLFFMYLFKSVIFLRDVTTPPWTPTKKGHGIMSRLLKHDLEIPPTGFKELRTDHIPIIFKQPSNNYHACTSHVNLYNQPLFIFHIKLIPTHHSPSMNLEFYLISIPCHFHNQPFHVHYMPRIIQLHHSQLIHPPTHAYSFTLCHYIIIQSNTCQASKNRESIKPWRTLA